ncbi:hypothetical protein [Aquibacillus salsiterrae]|uniref:YneQ n=1 Tax=Aquibacillus salsiterrae TaxID=2950439 RepID=A0A9X3WFV9_9BACI|nr:hypothetical protein [Aquibacillus salsiterrae]MDC3416281.1 hypothetical protein [Aquibacillus salsiterrae]
MAFGVKRSELKQWKAEVEEGQIAFLTHYWLDPRFPGCNTVTKVGCSNVSNLEKWGKRYGLQPEWIHQDPRFPHFDLFGKTQVEILQAEQIWDQLERFSLKE